MSGLPLFGLMLACGLVTFATRLSFIVLGRRIAISPRFAAALRFVPPAVLSALIAPELFLRHGAIELSGCNHRLWAGLLAAVVALLTRSVIATIAAGMLALWGLDALAGCTG